MMQIRRLGQTDIELSMIGYGTNSVGGHNLYVDVDEAAGVQLVRQAIDLGITHIDTADGYGFGRSEELIGEAIAGRRDEVVLATKGARRFGEHGQGLDNSPQYLREALQRSLKRLKTDYVDLYYIHHRDESTPAEEAFGALMEFKNEGLIRAAGISNWDVASLDAAATVGTVDAVQSRYNLLQREAEGGVIPWCEKNGASFIPWGPLAYGLLGGTYPRDFTLDEGDWRHRTGLFDAANLGASLDVADALKEIAAERTTTPAQVAIQWLLARPIVGSVIAGAKRPEQLEDNFAAGGAELPDSLVQRVSEITTGSGVVA